MHWISLFHSFSFAWLLPLTFSKDGGLGCSFISSCVGFVCVLYLLSFWNNSWFHHYQLFGRFLLRPVCGYISTLIAWQPYALLVLSSVCLFVYKHNQIMSCSMLLLPCYYCPCVSINSYILYKCYLLFLILSCLAFTPFLTFLAFLLTSVFVYSISRFLFLFHASCDIRLRQSIFNSDMGLLGESSCTILDYW